MTDREHGGDVSLLDAADAFRCLPERCQLAALHPALAHADALRDATLRPVHWVFRRGAQCYLHSFHVRANRRLALHDLQSPYGYGGPLANTDDADFLRLADRAYCNWARQNGIVAEFLRFHPLVPHATWYAGLLSFNRHTVCVDLTRDLLAQCEARRRTDIRRFAETGLEVVQVPGMTMLEAFLELYRQNMERVEAKPEYYFGAAYFEALLQLPQAESWLVRLGGRPIAGAVILVSAHAGTVEYHLSAVADGAERHRPMIGLLHAVAAHYQAASFRQFYLGGGRSTAADDSLLYFKQGFSSMTSPYMIGSRIHDADRYAQLKAQFPERAASGRILFYEDI